MESVECQPWSVLAMAGAGVEGSQIKLEDRSDSANTYNLDLHAEKPQVIESFQRTKCFQVF